MYYMYYNQITYSVLNLTLARGLVDPIGKTRGFKIRLYEKTCVSGYLSTSLALLNQSKTKLHFSVLKVSFTFKLQIMNKLNMENEAFRNASFLNVVLGGRFLWTLHVYKDFECFKKEFSRHWPTTININLLI